MNPLAFTPLRVWGLILSISILASSAFGQSIECGSAFDSSRSQPGRVTRWFQSARSGASRVGPFTVESVKKGTLNWWFRPINQLDIETSDGELFERDAPRPQFILSPEQYYDKDDWRLTNFLKRGLQAALTRTFHLIRALSPDFKEYPLFDRLFYLRYGDRTLAISPVHGFYTSVDAAVFQTSRLARQAKILKSDYKGRMPLHLVLGALVLSAPYNFVIEPSVQSFIQNVKVETRDYAAFGFHDFYEDLIFGDVRFLEIQEQYLMTDDFEERAELRYNAHLKLLSIQSFLTERLHKLPLKSWRGLEKLIEGHPVLRELISALPSEPHQKSPPFDPEKWRSVLKSLWDYHSKMSTFDGVLEHFKWNPTISGFAEPKDPENNAVYQQLVAEPFFRSLIKELERSPQLSQRARLHAFSTWAEAKLMAELTESTGLYTVDTEMIRGLEQELLRELAKKALSKPPAR